MRIEREWEFKEKKDNNGIDEEVAVFGFILSNNNNNNKLNGFG